MRRPAGGLLTQAAQVSTEPGFHVVAEEDRAAAEQRGADQLANPAYVQAIAPHVAAFADGSDTDSVLVDPFRLDWAPTRGDTAEVSYKNRYVVLAFDPQAQGDSDARPAEEFCRPGAWQEPPERGRLYRADSFCVRPHI